MKEGIKLFLLRLLLAVVTLSVWSVPLITPQTVSAICTGAEDDPDDDCDNNKEAATDKECDKCDEEEKDEAGSDDECDDDKGCDDKAPVAYLSDTADFDVTDTPFWHRPELGPSLSMAMRYYPSDQRKPYGEPTGYNWSMAYLDYGFELDGDTASFFHGNGYLSEYTKDNGQWIEDYSQRTGPKAGEGLWANADESTFIYSDASGYHYRFDRFNSSDFRMVWVADQFGHKLRFNYENGNDTKRPDYAVTADNRRCDFEYYSGLGGVDGDINGKLKSVTGPLRLDGSSVENLTASMSLEYTVKEHSGRNFTLLTAVTDMGGRHFTYDYKVANISMTDYASDVYAISRIRENNGDTTTMKWFGKRSLYLYHPDQSWEAMEFREISGGKEARIWNSKKGSFDNPYKKVHYKRYGNTWKISETEGITDPLGRQTITERLDSTGQGGNYDEFKADRPYLANRNYASTTTDSDGNVLNSEEYIFFDDSRSDLATQLGLAQNDPNLTDLYQKYGHARKVIKYGASIDEILSITTYKNMVVDTDTGELISRDIEVTAGDTSMRTVTINGVEESLPAGDGTMISYTQQIPATEQQWSAASMLDVPADFPHTSFTLAGTSATALNEELTQWNKTLREYDENGLKIMSRRHVGPATDDYVIDNFNVYYTSGDSIGELKEVWTPGANPIVLSNGSLTSTAGLKKVAYTYDFSGNVLTETYSYFDTDNTEDRYETITNSYNVFDQKIESRYSSDNTYELWSYACCGLASHTDRDGNAIIYDRDQRKRVIREIRMSAAGTRFMDTQYELDVHGNQIKVTDIAGAMTRVEYDDANRMIAAIDELGRRVEYGYDDYNNQIYVINPNGTVVRNFYDNQQRQIHTATYANSTDALISNLNATLADTTPMTADDGQPIVESTTYYSSGKKKATYGPYKHNPSTLAYSENDFSQKFEYDLGGRTIKTYTTTESGVIYTRSEYNEFGSIDKSYGPVLAGTTETAADLRQENIYNANGLLLYTVEALYQPSSDSNLIKRDVVAYDYDYRFGNETEIRVAQIDGSMTNIMDAILNADYTLTSSAVYDNNGYTLSYMNFGIRIDYKYGVENEFRFTEEVYSDNSSIKRIYDGPLLTKLLDRNGIMTEYKYDSAGNKTKEIINGELQNLSEYDKFKRVIREGDAENNSISYDYNVNNQVSQITFADGSKQHKEYNLLGQLVKQTGAQTYPIAYTYNANGQMISMTDGNDSQTQWLYNQYGQLKKKLYHGSTETDFDYSYTYDLFGQMTARTDKRGVTTKYHYDNLGRLRGTDYPDLDPFTNTVTPQSYSTLGDFLSNPLQGDDIRYVYDEQGRQDSIEGPTGITTFDYEGTSSRVIAEVAPNGTISRTYANGQLDTLFTGTDSASTDYLVDYDYTNGRLDQIQSTVNGQQSTTNYNYKPGLNILDNRSITNSSNSFNSLATYAYDDAYRLKGVSNSANGSVVSNYVYQLDPLGRRTSVTKSGSALDLLNPLQTAGSLYTVNYGYNNRSEVISAEYSANHSQAVKNYGFAYDAIGNRLQRTTDTLTTNYGSNSLNQFTSAQYSGSIPYSGKVTPTSGTLTSVTVDGEQVPDAQGQSSAALSGTIEIKNGKKMVVLAQDDLGRKSSATKDISNQFSYSYDQNGNLINDGKWNYYWNVENRLVTMETLDQRLEFAYDHMGRRVSKKVYSGSTANWILESHKKFVYDNYLQIQELELNIQNSTFNIAKQYVWDLSGQLLSLTTNNQQPTTMYYMHDANKNVVALVNPAGETVAAYEYSPFGQTIAAEGQLAHENVFRFSNEFFDFETDMVYYNYRYYNPAQGKWLSRDPLEEEGGVNLYAFVENDSINRSDYLGQFSIRSLISWVPFASGGHDWAANLIKFPVYPGITLNLDFYATANVKKCGCKGDGLMYDVNAGLEAYIKGGISYEANKRGTGKKSKNKGVRDENYNIFGKKRKIQRKNKPPFKDSKSFRDRDYHLDMAKEFPDCPEPYDRLIPSGNIYLFVRGSVGVYFGSQFNWQKTWPVTSWSLSGIGEGESALTGHYARGIYGASIEGGGGGNVSASGTLLKPSK